MCSESELLDMWERGNPAIPHIDAYQLPKFTVVEITYKFSLDDIK